MQSAGMGPAELIEVGQAGVDAFAPWVQILLPEEAGMYPFFRKTAEDGVFQSMTSEYFAGRDQRYVRLRYDEADPAAGSLFVKVELTRSPGGKEGSLPDPVDRPRWLVDGLEDAAARAACRDAQAAAEASTPTLPVQGA